MDDRKKDGWMDGKNGGKEGWMKDGTRENRWMTEKQRRVDGGKERRMERKKERRMERKKEMIQKKMDGWKENRWMIGKKKNGCMDE
ncbi:hypothetical protein QQF64_005138 [Cirrhinus molitorella]|uniref:Uncharacterized protein n=1 Tax=Cirrhinus molitorella TaxID=172907 RepID=A0ABR3MKR0_9TELE